MNFFKPILNFGARFVAAAVAATMIVFNRYEAGVRWGTGRSYLPGYVQDARFDADSATREEIIRKSRYFERNEAIIARLADIFEQYTIGTGLPVSPASSDEDWNQRKKEKWEQWCKVCDLTSLQSLSTIIATAARSWFIRDGEAFILKTRGRDQEGGPARPRIQLIEAHRVATPSNMTAQEGKKIIDGIEVDSRGRPVAYWMRDGFDDETFRRIPAQFVIHIFEPDRPGQYRGLPATYPILNALHDLSDLEILEMLAAKDAAEKSTIYETASGELDRTAEGMRRERYSQSTQNSSGTETTEQKTRFAKQTLGGRVMAIKLGEKVTQFLSNRPTVTQQWYWDYLTSKICAGVGISKLLVYPWSMQGTVTRADLDIMAGFFRTRSAILQQAVREIWLYVTQWEIQNDPEIADPPADWRNVTIRAPRSVNVDVGRNSSAMLSELKAGVRTYQDVYAELGLDWREQLRQKAKEAKYIRELAKEYDVEPGEIADIAGDAITEALKAEPNEQQSVAA